MSTGFPQHYMGSDCCLKGCKSKAKYVFMVGEGDFPVCEEHKELAKSELGTNFVSIENPTP